MGRIKTVKIKAKAFDILALYQDQFGKTFDDNKKILSSIAEFKSKKIRNILAGYITRLMEKNAE